MMVLTLLLAVNLTEPHTSLKRDIAWFGAFQMADFGSTQYAFSKGGVYETNWLVGPGNQPSKQLLIGTVGVAGFVALTHQLDKEGKHKAAWVIRILWGVAKSYAVFNNIHEARH